MADLVSWLRERGCPEEIISMLVKWGHAPSFVARL
jgi:hypothetical protein